MNVIASLMPTHSALARGGERRVRGRAAGRRGVTLFEVAISLVIMTFGVITVLMLIPSTVKVQQQARMSMLATAKAIELIQDFSSNIGGERQAEIEAVEPWDARPFCYSSTRFDLEHRTSRWDGGIIPLPLDIARRLDSDGDEIQQLLDQGAYLYYADPKQMPGIDPRYVNTDEPPNEAVKLIFAVVGYAQNNAITRFPWKAWPYRANYPSSPMMIELHPDNQLAPLPPASTPPLMQLQNTNGLERPWSGQYPYSTWNSVEGWANGNPDPARPQDRDPLVQDIANAAATYWFKLRGGQRSSDERLKFEDLGTPDSLIPLRRKLVDAVVAFYQAKLTAIGESPAYYNPPPGDAPYYQALVKEFRDHFAQLCRNAEALPGAAYSDAKARARAQIALRVQCMRFIAFAAQTFYLKHLGEAEPDFDQALMDNKDIKMDGTPLTADRLRYFHDCSKEAAMLYAASFPYDWGAPRPVTRCIGQDEPLIEFDLFSPRTQWMAGVPNTKATMWKPVSAQTITSIGLPGMFPGILTYSATGAPTWNLDESPFRTSAFPRDTRDSNHPFWGDASRFTLTRPFQAAERCRQLVFWSVDWQAYEDAETAPGAPLDASRLGRRGMSWSDKNGDRTYVPGASYDSLHLRNPERVLQFNTNVSAWATGSDVSGIVVGKRDGDGNLSVLTGQFGADRNHNYRLDRGHLPKSARLRAQTIVRFQFYDPRLTALHR